MKQRTPNATRLKARINAYAKYNAIPAQVVLQNFMFERIAERIARSRFAPNFILKGGLLLSSMLGLDKRSTMDMDTTIVGLPLTEDKIVEVIQEILNEPLDDNVTFEIVSSIPIRKDDVYGGFCLKLNAVYESVTTPIFIDITTGDSIVPKPIQFGYRKIFDNGLFLVYSYPIETILAEKLETIVTRGIFNKRPRDYYDVYMLTKSVQFDIPTLCRALLSTAEHRKSADVVTQEYTQRMDIIEHSDDIRRQWEKYSKTFSYAKGIPFETVVGSVRNLLESVLAKPS